jgi:hypothetical protein
MTKQIDVSLNGNVLIIVENNIKLKLFIRQNICASKENLSRVLRLHGTQFWSHW